MFRLEGRFHHASQVVVLQAFTFSPLFDNASTKCRFCSLVGGLVGGIYRAGFSWPAVRKVIDFPVVLRVAVCRSPTSSPQPWRITAAGPTGAQLKAVPPPATTSGGREVPDVSRPGKALCLPSRPCFSDQLPPAGRYASQESRWCVCRRGGPRASQPAEALGEASKKARRGVGASFTGAQLKALPWSCPATRLFPTPFPKLTGHAWFLFPRMDDQRLNRPPFFLGLLFQEGNQIEGLGGDHSATEKSGPSPSIPLKAKAATAGLFPPAEDLADRPASVVHVPAIGKRSKGKTAFPYSGRSCRHDLIPLAIWLPRLQVIPSSPLDQPAGRQGGSTDTAA